MRNRILCFLIALSFAPTLSFAWNGQGHQTAGALVYYYLKANNRPVIDAVLKTLSYHPWYKTQWAAATGKYKGEEKEIHLFELASTFPDDARGTKLGDGDKTKWHYVDYPYVVPGKNVKSEEPRSPNAEQKIVELLRTLPTAADSAQRAIDLCWLFHLIEDTHQPLHCASMYDPNHPTGDKGGNSVSIKIDDEAVQNLHHFWDAAPVADNEVPADKAWSLMTAYHPAAVTAIDSAFVHNWIKNESLPMAIKYAYLDGKVNGYYNLPSVLNDTYVAKAKKIAEQRLVESAYRMSKALIQIYHS